MVKCPVCGKVYTSSEWSRHRAQERRYRVGREQPALVATEVGAKKNTSAGARRAKYQINEECQASEATGGSIMDEDGRSVSRGAKYRINK